MAANRKYLVLKTREIRELLNNEQQSQLLQMIEAMNAARHSRDPNKPIPHYFTLNTADKFAIHALEAYIEAIDQDEVNSTNLGVQDARSVAVAARTNAIMNHDGTKFPT